MSQVLDVIAQVRGDFSEKFGLPRQSGLAEHLLGRVVFEPEYSSWEAVRGLEGFSHIWLLWGFSMNRSEKWTPTVRPPKLGGNRRIGVFATRAPYRPNPIGLSSVELVSIERGEDGGPVLVIAGGDMADGTPVYDIKPYLPYTDSHPEARGGFAQPLAGLRLQVEIPAELEDRLPAGSLQALREALSLDPRPGYQGDPEREYGMAFCGMQVRFRVCDGAVIVTDVENGPQI